MWEYNNELYHHGIKGMRWGIRRYQNPDGTLTEEGRRRYGVNSVVEWKDKKRAMDRRQSELRSKANKKYNIDNLERNKRMEDSYNENVVRRNAEFWYGEGSSRESSENANYYAQRAYERSKSTYHNDQYKEAREKADKFVESKMKKEFGQSYDTWTNESETVAAIAVGATFAATLGVMAAAALSGMKK